MIKPPNKIIVMRPCECESEYPCDCEYGYVASQYEGFTDEQMNSLERIMQNLTEDNNG